jgi:hypothetical protein
MISRESNSMQVNNNIQYNEENAKLTLDNPSTESDAELETSATQDEADLNAAENGQKEVIVNGTQVISSPRHIKYARVDDRLIVAGSMFAGVMFVVTVYMLLVFL